VAGCLRGLPEPVVSGQIAIARPKLCKPPADEAEMTRLLDTDLDPVVEERERELLVREASNEILSHVDGIELDMTQRMQQRDTPLEP